MISGVASVLPLSTRMNCQRPGPTSSSKQAATVFMLSQRMASSFRIGTTTERRTLSLTCRASRIWKNDRSCFAQVSPPGAWGPVREPGDPQTKIGGLIMLWLLFSAATFGGMFMLGSLLIGTWSAALGYAGAVLVACAGIWVVGRRAGVEEW